LRTHHESPSVGDVLHPAVATSSLFAHPCKSTALRGGCHDPALFAAPEYPCCAALYLHAHDGVPAPHPHVHAVLCGTCASTCACSWDSGSSWRGVATSDHQNVTAPTADPSIRCSIPGGIGAYGKVVALYQRQALRYACKWIVGIRYSGHGAETDTRGTIGPGNTLPQPSSTR